MQSLLDNPSLSPELLQYLITNGHIQQSVSSWALREVIYQVIKNFVLAYFISKIGMFSLNLLKDSLQVLMHGRMHISGTS